MTRDEAKMYHSFVVDQIGSDSISMFIAGLDTEPAINGLLRMYPDDQYPQDYPDVVAAAKDTPRKRPAHEPERIRYSLEAVPCGLMNVERRVAQYCRLHPQSILLCDLFRARTGGQVGWIEAERLTREAVGTQPVAHVHDHR